MTENIVFMENNNLLKKIKKPKKKKKQPKISSKPIQPPEKTSKQKELEKKLHDMLCKRRLKAHMKLEKWRSDVFNGSFSF